MIVLTFADTVETKQMKINNYEVEKNIERIKQGKPTGFINQNIYQEINKKLKNCDYNIYKPYKDAEKIILYTTSLPYIKIYKIESYNQLTHQSIMGSLFGLNISTETFGDIILHNNYFYIYLLNDISDLIVNELNRIGNYYVKLTEVDKNFLNSYEKDYEKIEIIVSSLRIDTIISRLINTNRDKAKIIIKNKQVTLNYNILNKNDYIIKENDVFSIKKFGKYKFIKIIKKTKKDNYIIWINKYI